MISVPKSGSSSLIKWLVSTQQIFGDMQLTSKKVENNVIWTEFVDDVIYRDDQIGFYLSDQQILDYDDRRFRLPFKQKPNVRRTSNRTRRIRNRSNTTRRASNRHNKTRRIEKQYININDMNTTGEIQRRERKKKRKERRKLITEKGNIKIIKKKKVRPKKKIKVVKKEGDRKKKRNTIKTPKDKRKRRKRSFNYAKLEKINTTHHTVGKSVFYFHLPYMARIFGIKYANTKILITLRNPIPRLKSNYLFFIGDERKKLSKLYGDVNKYLQYIISNPLLKIPFDTIKHELQFMNRQMENGEIVDIQQWFEIFKIYKLFLVNMITVCKQDFEQMGFNKNEIMERCKEKDLIRSAFGMSCYIVPTMYWFMTNMNPERNFRIIQSELMFDNPNEYVTRILCWVMFDENSDSCNKWKGKQWSTKGEWRASKQKSKKDEIHIGLQKVIKEELMECNIGLKHFIERHPVLQLSKMDLTKWE